MHNNHLALCTFMVLLMSFQINKLNINASIHSKVTKEKLTNTIAQLGFHDVNTELIIIYFCI